MRYILLLVVLLQSSFGFSQEKFNWATAQKFQQELNKEYANRETTPLMAEDLATFKGLDFYPINKKFFFCE